jgi:uncharacterized protein YbaP (TraB family)
VLLWWALGCAGQKRVDAPHAAADATNGPQREILVWRVERRGAEPSYLMGTCHLQVPLERWLPPPYDRSLDEARVLYTEIGDAPIDIFEVLELFPVRDASLRDEVGAEAFDELSREMRNGGMPATLLDRLPPWMAYALLDVQELSRRFDALNEPGTPILDRAVVLRAERESVKVRALETVEDQLALFGRFEPIFEQALDADTAVAAKSESQLEDVVALCSTFDVSHVEASLAEPDPTGFSDALLGERNRAWMVTLRPELRRGGVFVAVGAAHMLGSDGLLASIAAEGYSVERLVGGAPPATVVPPAPAEAPVGPWDPAAVAHWTEVVSAENVPPLCAREGLLRTCFGFDETSCRAEMQRAASMCVAQHGDRLPAPDSELAADVRQEVVACMPVGAVFVGLVQGEMGDAPMCTMIRAAMDGAMQSIMDGQ